jgi:hypothetical protein
VSVHSPIRSEHDLDSAARQEELKAVGVLRAHGEEILKSGRLPKDHVETACVALAKFHRDAPAVRRLIRSVTRSQTPPVQREPKSDEIKIEVKGRGIFIYRGLDVDCADTPRSAAFRLLRPFVGSHRIALSAEWDFAQDHAELLEHGGTITRTAIEKWLTDRGASIRG